MPKREWNDVPAEAFKMSWSTVDSLELSPCRQTLGEKEAPSEPMFYGTVGHALAENVTAGEVSIQKAMSTKYILDLADELATEEGFDVLALLGRHALDWASELSFAIKAWHVGPWAEAISKWEVVETEKPRSRLVSILPNGQEFYLVTGGIDLITLPTEGAKLRGVDYKLTGSGWWKDKSSARGQDDIYAYLAEPDFGLIEDWSYVVYNRRKGEWLWHNTTVTPKSMRAMVERCIGWAEYMTLENRPHLCTPTDGGKRGWWARPAYNPAWNTCPTCRYLGDEFDSQERPSGPWWRPLDG